MAHSYLVSILSYDPATGVFHWKHNSSKSNRWNTKYAGRCAGSVFTSQHGMQYIRIKIDGSNYLAHRLAWFITRREWPSRQIDHKNGDGLDNRMCNLRSATQSQNRANSGPLLRGIDPFPNGKWRAKISIDCKQIHLGMFDTQEEAYVAYAQALTSVHGDYAIHNRR